MTKQFYVVAQYVMRPRDKRKTSDPRYMSNAENFQYDEMFNIVTRIKPKELATHGVILDLTNRKVIKNGYTPGKTYEEVLQYFIDNYREKFTQMLGDYVNEIKELTTPVISAPAVSEEPVVIENHAEFKIGKAPATETA